MYMLIIKLVQFSDINGILKKEQKNSCKEKGIIFKGRKDRSKALIKKKRYNN